MEYKEDKKNKGIGKVNVRPSHETELTSRVSKQEINLSKLSS